MGGRSVRGAAREVFLWVVGGLGALCLLGLVAGWAFSVTPVVLTSGSMAPTYDTGSLVLTHEVAAADVRPGDVVSVADPAGGRVTHRVVDVAPTDGGAVLRLRGDANDAADPTTYAVAHADRALLGVPLLGYLLAAAATPLGLLVLLGVVVAALRLGLADPAAPLRRRRATTVGALVSALALAVGLGATGNGAWALSSAYWTTNVTASTTATTPAAPADITAPTVAMTYPKATSLINNGQWGGGCTPSPGICGTASDEQGGSGLAAGTASYELRRTDVSPNQCWNGSAFASTACGTYRAAAGTQASWSVAVPFNNLVTNGTYAVRVRVLDVAGNANRPAGTPSGTPDVTFTR